MPIIKLQPFCKTALWGGNELKYRFDKHFHNQRLAETWELSCHPNGESIIANGPFAGQTLRTFLTQSDGNLLGENCRDMQDFPLLIKWIDAAQPLSVQVHPNDTVAHENGEKSGKSEMWYILSCRKGAYIYYGLRKSVTKETLKQALYQGTITSLLQKIPVCPGDVFYIPGGTIHAIGGGILLAEIQQNADITYRLYDYDRREKDGSPRPLHLASALKASDYTPTPLPVQHKHTSGETLVTCPYFDVIFAQAPYTAVSDSSSFVSILIIQGYGVLSCQGETMPFCPGDSLFLPANCGTFSIDRAEEGFEMHNRTNTRTNTTPANNGAPANDIHAEVQALITRVPSQKKDGAK